VSLSPRPATSPLFPYTTLFRSGHADLGVPARKAHVGMGHDRHVHTHALTPVIVDVHVRRDFGTGVEAHQSRAPPDRAKARQHLRSEEHTSELQSRENLVCRLLL